MIKAFSLLFLCGVLALLSGCAGTAQKPFAWQDASVDLVWPAPPDPPRVRYLRSLSGPEDFKEQSRTSELLTWLLGEQSQGAPFVTPFSVAVSPPGILWVADNGSQMLYRYDPGLRRVDYFTEFLETNLISPSGVAVDNERQRVFLADAGLKCVFVLDFDGNCLHKWTLPNNLGRPAGMAVDTSGRLLVADAEKGVVHVFNTEGALVRSLNSKKNPDGRFSRPLNVAVGPKGEILVLDAFAFRVEVLDAEGELLNVIGGLGDAPGYMARPRGLAVDQEGHVFVSDAAFDNIQAFDMTGTLLMFWGGAGRGAGQFNLPAGLFIDAERRIFVADALNRRIEVFQLLH